MSLCHLIVFILFLFVKYYVSWSLKLSLFLIYFFFENVVLSLGEQFIYGTETMICHLKRQGMEVGVWDGNTGLTVSFTQFLLSETLTYFPILLLSKWYIEFLPTLSNYPRNWIFFIENEVLWCHNHHLTIVKNMLIKMNRQGLISWCLMTKTIEPIWKLWAFPGTSSPSF